MEHARKYSCHCCNHSEELKTLSGRLLDVYELICSTQKLENDDTRIIACLQCRKFLEEVHCFRYECHADHSGKLEVNSHKVDLVFRNSIDENSAKIGIKTEITEENEEINKIDIQINKKEVNFDPENSQHISGTSREVLLVANIEESEIEVHNSLNSNENSLLVEQTSKSSNRSVKRLLPNSQFIDKPFKCLECSFETTTSRNLKCHIGYKHSDEKPFSCDNCIYRCNTKMKMFNHMKKHLKEKPFKCNECSYETVWPRSLKYHIASKHSNETPFSCDKCDYRCKIQTSLSQHMKTHLEDKPFKCSECSFETGLLRSLKYHIASKHSDEKPFSCNQCTFRTIKKSILSVHMKTHLANRDRPYKCSECSHETTTSRNLESHVRRKHSDERPFSCDQCNYHCKIKTNLYYHMKTHLMKHERPFKCNECSYEAMTSSHLNAHIKSKHSDEKPFSCDQCNYRCKTKPHLFYHMKTHLSDHVS